MSATPSNETVLTQYPEHEKLQAISDVSQEIGEFLDCGRWTLCELRDAGTRAWNGTAIQNFQPVNIQDALAEYFGIDQKKIEAEKRQMLEAIRAAH